MPKPANVIESQETKTELHVKSIPVNWAGYLGAYDRGLGVFFPGTTHLTCYHL